MNSSTPLVMLLQDAIAAEKIFEVQLRDFAAAVEDDEEVRDLFAGHADQTRSQAEKLRGRLEQVGGSDEDSQSALAGHLNVAPQIAQAGNAAEERTLQHLIISYTVESGECAMYEALAAASRSAGDETTENLAREIQAEELAAAEKFWHLLPSRSKIAFNMLTVSEVDPAVETKLADNRLIES